MSNLQPATTLSGSSGDKHMIEQEPTSPACCRRPLDCARHVKQGGTPVPESRPILGDNIGPSLPCGADNR